MWCIEIFTWKFLRSKGVGLCYDGRSNHSILVNKICTVGYRRMTLGCGVFWVWLIFEVTLSCNIKASLSCCENVIHHNCAKFTLIWRLSRWIWKQLYFIVIWRKKFTWNNLIVFLLKTREIMCLGWGNVYKVWRRF